MAADARQISTTLMSSLNWVTGKCAEAAWSCQRAYSTQTSAKQNAKHGDRSVCDSKSDEMDDGYRDWRAANFDQKTGQTWDDENQIQKKNETGKKRRQTATRATGGHTRHDPSTDGPRQEGDYHL